VGRRRRAQPSTPLSGYRLMWMMVMFDLPVDTAAHRKAASDFRNNLKDLGFVMAQYSVYLKHTSGQSECDAVMRKVEVVLPEGGRVYVHCLTDKQYERIVRFEKKRRLEALQNPEQYELL
jgi:CRISPR-associated protein Cas2